MTLQSPRLGAPAFAYLHAALSYQWPAGWQLIITGRREGQDDYENEFYDVLDVFELFDVLTERLALKLGV